MARYEYKVVPVRRRDFEGDLDELGRLGWRVVGVVGIWRQRVVMVRNVVEKSPLTQLPRLGALVAPANGGKAAPVEADRFDVVDGRIVFVKSGEPVEGGAFDVTDVAGVDLTAGEPRSGETWSDEENDQLRAEVANLPDWKIAHLHGRSDDAIRSQSRKLGLRS